MKTQRSFSLGALVLLFGGGFAAVAEAQVLTPPGLQPGDSYHLVFATSRSLGVESSTTLPSTSPMSFFGGLDAADYSVTIFAFQGLLPFNSQNDSWAEWDFVNPTWQAILSDSNNSALDRLNIGGPIYKTNGELVATSKADLFDGSIESPIDRDELGNELVGSTEVWTGTGVSGVTAAATCNNWVSNASGSTGSTGLSSAISGFWTSASSRSCNQTARLYGLSPLLTVPLPGDFDGDGTVDADDYSTWAGLYGAPESIADANGDGVTDAADYTVWRDAHDASESTALPEPTTATLLVLAALATGGWGRSRRRSPQRLASGHHATDSLGAPLRCVPSHPVR